MIKISVQIGLFDIGQEIDAVTKNNPRIGGVASFVGYMRNHNEGDTVSTMTLEHYPGMTEKALQKIVDEALERWSLDAATVIHRVGNLSPGDPIVLVVTACEHRKQAFESCEFIMDYLKNRAPFWKKETTQAGERWLDTKQSDKEAESRWG